MNDEETKAVTLDEAAEAMYKQFCSQTMQGRHILGWKELPEMVRSAWKAAMQFARQMKIEE